MKRAALIAIVIIMCFGAAACGFNTENSFFNEADIDEPTDEPTEEPTDEPTDDPTEIPTQAPTEAPTSSIPDGAESAGLFFMSSEIDIFISMLIPQWAYSTEMIPGQVFFYPEGDTSGETGVSISSQDNAGAPIKAIWENIAVNFSGAVPGFAYQQEEDVPVGEYAAGRYSFTSDWFYGDYFLWNTEDKLYICSFTAQEDEYEDLLVKLLTSLETFQVLSDMQE